MGPSSLFSSSRRFKQAVFGFRFRSLTCCSKLVITSTAWWRIFSLVWALSVFRCIIHILPSSLKASLMSLTRILSRALLACRLSFSLSALISGGSSSSPEPAKASPWPLLLLFPEATCQRFCFDRDRLADFPPEDDVALTVPRPGPSGSGEFGGLNLVWSILSGSFAFSTFTPGLVSA